MNILTRFHVLSYRQFITCLMLLLLPFGTTAIAQTAEIDPGPDLVLEGVPRIPESLATSIKRYTTAYGLPMAAWEPQKHAIMLKDLSNSFTAISRVDSPGKDRQVISLIPVGGVYDLYFDPNGKYLVYNKDTDGNEAFQMYFYELSTHKSIRITDGKSRNTEPVWSNAGDRIIYSSTPSGENGVSLYVMNPASPETNRLLVKSSGNYFKAFDWSPDDKMAVYTESISNASSVLWMIDVATGERTRLSPETKEADYYDLPQFSKDSKGIYVITDHNSDVRRLAFLDLTTKALSYLSDQINWDVEEFRISPDGSVIAFITNENGISRFHLLSVKTGKERDIPAIPVGVMSDLKWDSDSQNVGFNLRSSHTPRDVYSINIKTGNLEHWSSGVTGQADLSEIPDPELIHWKSFDERLISGFLFRPPKKFTGKRPVVIEIHGGPEDEYRPTFWGQDNYLLNEEGVAKIYPNVRGSTGFGKAFLNLDNEFKREDAIKDIGSLLDWIAKQPDLDANRVMVTGSSYGGYAALSVAATYNNRIRAAESIVGPTNLASFLENTEGWRRDVRRQEYGDERNPKDREFLERISPLHNASKITKPLFIVQGKNDPRVKASEAEQMISALRGNKATVWYLLAKDEGHDFINQRNIDYVFYSTVLFIQEYLLKQNG
ncbi:MAG TPA: prolyl oligopeptidase family serine peptidase [Blastocatellia bacterium]|nr:prolyl oligopeptidase family serine peptidase [Blastocatellia bacterium]